MGGANSGRKRTASRGYVEQFPVIDLRVLKRARLLRHGECTYDTLRWRNQDLKIVEVRLFVDLSDADEAAIRITGDVPDQRAVIECVPCPFGGYRCYFLCPLNRTRCEQLFLVDGTFASRRAHKIIYASQSESELSRARRRVRKLHKQIDGDARYSRRRGRKRWSKMQDLRTAEGEFAELYRDRLRTMVGDIQ